MASPSYARSLIHLTKRLRLSPPASAAQFQKASFRPLSTENASTTSKPWVPLPDITAAQAEKAMLNIRLPRAVQAAYLDPLRRQPTHGHAVCDLQLRSYSVRNVEVFADFAMRAAYYLGLAARGPVPLPRIVNRWTVPRSNFVHKKSQENFERITLRRLIQIQDGHPETVAVWLAFLKKHQFFGVGLKANTFEDGGLEIDEKELEAKAEKEVLEKEKKIRMASKKQSLKQLKINSLQEKVPKKKKARKPFSEVSEKAQAHRLKSFEKWLKLKEMRRKDSEAKESEPAKKAPEDA